MDFSNHGKIKKIFYIVAIISMLLSIKTKVLGYTIPDTDTNISLTPAMSDNDYNLFCLVKQVSDVNNKPCYEHAFVVYKGNLTVSVSSTRFTFHISGSGYKSYRDKMTFSEGFNDTSRKSLSDYLYTNFNTLANIESRVTNTASSWYYNLSDGWNISSYFSNKNIYNYNNNSEIIFNITEDTIYPYFENITEIENGNPDGAIINPGDFSNTDNLYFHLLEIQTGVSSADDSIYYYLDKTFLLNKDSEYYSTMLADASVFYYYIPRYKLGLSTNSSYLYVINNSKNQIQNSHGLIEKDTENGIYDVITSDTTGVITATEEESDRMKNIEESIANNENTINNINNTINNTNITEDTESDIDTSLSFDNSAPNFSNLYGSFFSRLSSTISSLGDYNLSSVETINLPIPFSQQTITLNSNIISSNIPQFLTILFNTFWLFIFGKYFLAYILYIYRLIASGHILDNISSNNEVITNDVL